MMGPRQEAQPALFYEFSLEDHVPQKHFLRSIDRFVDLSGTRSYLTDFYSHTGRPSVDPELLIRMLLVGYPLHRRQSARLSYFDARTASFRATAPAVMFFQGFAFLRGGMTAWAPRSAMASWHLRVS